MLPARSVKPIADAEVRSRHDPRPGRCMYGMAWLNGRDDGGLMRPVTSGLGVGNENGSTYNTSRRVRRSSLTITGLCTFSPLPLRRQCRRRLFLFLLCLLLLLLLQGCSSPARCRPRPRSAEQAVE